MDRIRRLSHLLAAGVPGRRRRSETAEELRAHLEDLIEEARFLGLEGREAERHARRRFGRPDGVVRGLREANRRRLPVKTLAAAALVLVAILAARPWPPSAPSAPLAAAPEDPAGVLSRLDDGFLSARRDGDAIFAETYAGAGVRLRYEWFPGDEMIHAGGPAEGAGAEVLSALSERIVPLVPSAPSEWVADCRLSWDPEFPGSAILAEPVAAPGVAAFQALRIRLDAQNGFDRLEVLRDGRWLSCEMGLCSVDGRRAVVSTRLEGSSRSLVRRYALRDGIFRPAGFDVLFEDGAPRAELRPEPPAPSAL